MKNKMGIAGALVALGLAACSSSGTDSSTAATVTGSLASGTASVSKLLTADGCLADTVIATSTAGTTTTATVDSNCDFSLSLATGRSYVISFVEGDEFRATLVFNADDTNTRNVFKITSAVNLDLGTITFTGSTAACSNNPLEDLDSDDDGVSDYDDDDDDNDGIDDWYEDDCDLDGYDDDYDDDDSCDGSNDNSSLGDGSIFRVRPGLNSTNVELDEDVKIYVACTVDATTVNSSTFIVKDESDHEISCEYDVENENGIAEIECDHEETELFDPNMTYTIVIDGITCQDATEVESLTGSFTTGSSDDEDDDSDDDDSDDDEDESEDD